MAILAVRHVSFIADPPVCLLIPEGRAPSFDDLLSSQDSKHSPDPPTLTTLYPARAKGYNAGEEMASFRFAGVILAGGAGRRWGAPKAWAQLPDGRSFLAACTETLEAAGAESIVATLPPGVEIPSLPGLDQEPLPEPDLDMFGSLRWGLRRLEATRWQCAVILPVDHPLVKPSTVAALVEAGPPAAIPAYRGKHGHPICLGCRVIAGILAGSLRGPTLREVLRAVGAHEVSVDDPGVIANCNTPQALDKALLRQR
jgi:CTP:molybdopterin cytidylyltransferase MocA